MASYSSTELANLVGISPHTVRHYVKIGVLPPVEFRGAYTRYTDDHLLRLQVISHVGGSHAYGIQRLKKLFASAPRERLEELAGRHEVVAKETKKLGASWQVVTLAPGVELSVRDDAAAPALRLVAELLAHCATASARA
jgi:DNA-binding transcriptional MerR regulator